MNTVLFGLAVVFLGLAAVIHVYIFYLESIAWSKPRTWKTFGLRSQEDADVVRPGLDPGVGGADRRRRRSG